MKSPDDTTRDDSRRAAMTTAGWAIVMLALAVAACILTAHAINDRGSVPAAGTAAHPPIGPTGEVDLSSADGLVRLDHSSVARNGVTHASDEPGASVAAY
jgi:hypothetical protein